MGQKEVYDLVRKCSGLTCEEISKVLGVGRSATSRSLRYLLRRGYVKSKVKYLASVKRCVSVYFV